MDEATFWATVEGCVPMWRTQFWRRLGAAADVDELLNDLRLRLWRAYERGAFEAPAQINRYGSMAVSTLVIDRHRRRRPAESSLDVPLSDEMPWDVADADPTPDARAEMLAWRAQFWGLLLPHLKSPAERIAIGTLALDYSPSEVAAHWPHLFATVRSVYDARRIALQRLRGNRAAPLRAALLAWRQAG